MRALIAVLLCILVTACARRPTLQAEAERYELVQQSLFEGMLRADLMRAVGREPIFTGRSIDSEELVFEYRTGDRSGASRFRTLRVWINSDTGTVSGWQ